MKRTKTLTKKERKAVTKAIKELGPVNQKPHKEHHHDMWCLTSFLARQEQRKHDKLHERQEKRAAFNERRKIAQRAARAKKAEAKRLAAEKRAAHAQ